jgi:hypothetical protein
MVVNTRKLFNSHTYLQAQATQRTVWKDEKAHWIKNEIGYVCITLWHVHVYIYLLSYPNSPILFHSQRAFLWQFNVAGNSELYVCFHVTCLILSKFGISPETYLSPQYRNLT